MSAEVDPVDAVLAQVEDFDHDERLRILRASIEALRRTNGVKGCLLCEDPATAPPTPHDASTRCQSGGRVHCSCSVCF